MGLDNQDHVRYPLYNASKNETIEEIRKNAWENHPLKLQCIENEEGRKATAKQLCYSIQEYHAKGGTFSQ
jgi:hypothetical protein